MPVSHGESRLLGARIGSGKFKEKFAETHVAEITSGLEVPPGAVWAGQCRDY